MKALTIKQAIAQHRLNLYRKARTPTPQGERTLEAWNRAVRSWGERPPVRPTFGR